ncbi:MAG: DUF5106 domain-containing protein [Bacteroidia bacterium]
MNIKTLIFFILASLACSLSAQGYEIEVRIKGFEEDTAFLAYHLADKQYMQDTVAVKAGKIVFKGEKALEPGIYLVVLPPDNNFFEVIIPEGDQQFSMQTTLDDYSNSMKVSGSVENELFYQNLKDINTLSAEIQPLQEQIGKAEEGSDEKKQLQDALQDVYKQLNDGRKGFAENHPELLYSKVIKTMQEPEVPEVPADVENPDVWRYAYYKKHYFDNVDFGEKGLIRTPVFRQKFMRYMDKVASPHYDSLKLEATRLVEYSRKDSMVFQYVVIELLNHYAASKIMCHDAVYVHLVDMVYRNGGAWWADEEQVKKMTDRANALRHTMCGNIAPPINMLDANNERQSLYSVEKEYTVLYFWDYDCGHCRKVTPELVKWFAGADHSKIGLFTVSINGDLEIWKKKLGEYGLDTLPAINVQDHTRETGFGYYYDLRSTPRIFLLDNEKHILAKQISVESLDEILVNMLKKELDKAEGEKK